MLFYLIWSFLAVYHLQNDLHCDGWGVKLYSPPPPPGCCVSHILQWPMQWQQWAANVSHKEVVVEGRMALHSASLLTSHTVNMTSRTPAIHSSQPLSTQADATVSMKCSPLALQQLVYSERLDLLTASHWLNFETVLNNESAHCII